MSIFWLCYCYFRSYGIYWDDEFYRDRYVYCTDSSRGIYDPMSVNSLVTQAGKLNSFLAPKVCIERLIKDVAKGCGLYALKGGGSGREEKVTVLMPFT